MLEDTGMLANTEGCNFAIASLVLVNDANTALSLYILESSHTSCWPDIGNMVVVVEVVLVEINLTSELRTMFKATLTITVGSRPASLFVTPTLVVPWINVSYHIV